LADEIGIMASEWRDKIEREDLSVKSEEAWDILDEVIQNGQYPSNI
jgi:hypothetical protein